MFILAALLAANTLIVDIARREVRFAATVQPSAMERRFGVRGHHAIVWKGGGAKRMALFVAEASDRDVRRALDSLGAKRGENLVPDTWNARDDPKNPAPDLRVEGTAIDVYVEWRGSRGRVPLSSLIREKGAPAPLFDFRYGGNEAWQKEFRSGCIVCLYSCPGGAIGNRARTIRDSVRNGVVYSAIESRLPPEGTRVTIILKPRMEEP
ncbi:MAG TPA: YdjY domain-containing protein [Thermoanaerobaculia bacterium]|nr:YdjY domain-containing protein [Thermoanaerobaculia bacterium]